jgi:hypothetical protein
MSWGEVSEFLFKFTMTVVLDEVKPFYVLQTTVSVAELN